ncbi:MAG: helix-turn-helix domain-containing protein [Phycisphaerales bacterium]
MRLTGYAWPGNVRQLINVVENMVVMAIGDHEDGSGAVRIGTEHIPAEIISGDADGQSEASTTQAGTLAGTSLEQLEKQAIRETLKLTGGNREQTAKLLGIGERTLYRKLKEYGLR